MVLILASPFRQNHYTMLSFPEKKVSKEKRMNGSDLSKPVQAEPL
jgi:hypothetical protein